MKKGRHCLHLQANEEDVYRLMDTKEPVSYTHSDAADEL